MRQSERIQKSSEELVRYGPPDLAILATNIVYATNVTPIEVKEGFPAELEDLLSKFATEMRASLGPVKVGNQPSSNRHRQRRTAADKRGQAAAGQDEDRETQSLK
jgi:hypothetical protein